MKIQPHLFLVRSEDSVVDSQYQEPKADETLILRFPSGWLMRIIWHEEKKVHHSFIRHRWNQKISKSFWDNRSDAAGNLGWMENRQKKQWYSTIARANLAIWPLSACPVLAGTITEPASDSPAGHWGESVL